MNSQRITLFASHRMDPAISPTKIYFRPIGKGPLVLPAKKKMVPYRVNHQDYIYRLTDREAMMAKGLVFPDELLVPGNME